MNTTDAAIETMDHAIREIAALRDRNAALEGTCRSAGICMSCLYGASDPIGCTDCLGTGWDGGDPHRQIEVLEARVAKLEAALEQWRKELCALCEDTEERYAEIAAKDLEGKEGAYARGRIREAKSIRKAMGEVIYEDLAALKDAPQ